jgi:hypothetical protein
MLRSAEPLTAQTLATACIDGPAVPDVVVRFEEQYFPDDSLHCIES